MTACDINLNKVDVISQINSINRAVLKLNIDQLEDEILGFEDALQDVLVHPEKSSTEYLERIKDKFCKLRALKEKLAVLEQNI